MNSNFNLSMLILMMMMTDYLRMIYVLLLQCKILIDQHIHLMMFFESLLFFWCCRNEVRINIAEVIDECLVNKVRCAVSELFMKHLCNGLLRAQEVSWMETWKRQSGLLST